MKLSAKGLALIKTSESCKLEAYRCPANVLTIGYGHTGPDVIEGQVITKAEADILLKRDVAQFEACVGAKCPSATQSQFDAMVSLAFNIGEGAFKKSSVARLHNAGRFPEAQQAFSLWNKAGGKVMGGLVTRRAREADRYDDDDLPTDVPGMPQAVEGEEPLSKSRNRQGQVIAGAGTIVTAAAQMMPEQSAVPAIPEPTSILDSGATVLSLATAHQGVFTEFAPLVQQFWWVPLIIIAAGLGYAWYARSNDRATGRA